jgi:PPOX class probable F420-dependent enzyme
VPRLTEAQRQFLDNPYCAVVTTIRPDGTPHNTVVWVEQADGEVAFNTATGRAKVRHLERNSAVALTVLDSSDPYRWLSLGGTAELTREDADDQIDRLAKKYTGSERFAGRKPTEDRLKVRIRLERIHSYGLDG